MKDWKLSSGAYDFLKWAGLIALPAIGEFYLTIAQIWSLPYGDAVAKTLFALGLLIGVLIGVSNKNFYNSAINDGVAEEVAPEEGEE